MPDRRSIRAALFMALLGFLSVMLPAKAFAQSVRLHASASDTIPNGSESCTAVGITDPTVVDKKAKAVSASEWLWVLEGELTAISGLTSVDVFVSRVDSDARRISDVVTETVQDTNADNDDQIAISLGGILYTEDDDSTPGLLYVCATGTGGTATVAWRLTGQKP